MSFTDVFTSSLVNPSEVSYRDVTLSATTTLVWPDEGPQTTDVLARTMDVTASSAGFSFLMPDATKGSLGYNSLFNNYGSNSFTVADADGVPIATVAAGEAWQVYLTDDSTEAGGWKSFQYASFTSSANAASLAGTGLTSSANQLIPNVPVTEINANYAAVSTDRAKLFSWTGVAGTFTLPDPTSIGIGNGWYVEVKNLGDTTLTVTPSGSSLIDGAADKDLEPGDSGIFVTDGTDFYVVGFGQSSTFAFDTISINVAGTGDYTLTGNELNRISYNFTGLLTGNRNIIVPATVQQYWIRNSTTGAFTLTVKVSGMTGVAVSGANILYCDGTDVRSANTGGLSVPIAINDGGTGATTASSARSNLGAGVVGDAIFTAADTATVWTVLGPAPSGTVDGGTF